MTITVRWYDDQQTIVIYDISGRWTWDEFYNAHNQGLEMIREKPHTVHAIILRAQDEYRSYAPANAFTHSVSLIRKLPPNVGMGVIVDRESKGLRILHDAIARVYQPYGRRIAMVATLEDGLARIQQYDRT